MLMKSYFRLSLIALILFGLNSCYVTRTTVGDGPKGKAEAVKYDKSKQFYLFWGLMALGHNQPQLPAECGFQVKSVFNFWDMLVSGITGGIFSMRSTRILVYRDGPCDPKLKKLERKKHRKELKEEK
jgi:hypothetical protein